MKSSSMKRPWRLLVAGVVLTVVGAGAGVTAANAYTLSGCKWPSSTVYHTRSVPSTFTAPATYAALDWSATTDVNLGQTSGQPFKVSTYTASDGNAGITSRSCNGLGTIVAATSYGNMNSLPYLSANCRRAPFAHEIGHGLGLDHNNSTSYVLMYHSISACTVNGIYLPQQDDKNGMNAMY